MLSGATPSLRVRALKPYGKVWVQVRLGIVSIYPYRAHTSHTAEEPVGDGRVGDDATVP